MEPNSSSAAAMRLLDPTPMAAYAIVAPDKAAARRPKAPSHAELCRALEIVEERLAAESQSADLLFLRGNLLEIAGRGADALESYRTLLDLDPERARAWNNVGNLLAAAGKHGEAHEAFVRAEAARPGDPMCETSYANSLRKQGELEKAREHFQAALDADPDYWPAHLGMSAILRERNQPEDAYAHRRAAFKGRSIVPLTYRGEQPPIAVLELAAIGPGNTRLQNFLSDGFFRRYLVAAEFFEPGTPLPPHDLVINAIGDADVAAAALDGAKALLRQTTAPVINAPDAVLATGRCQIARRLAKIPGVITAKTVQLPKRSLLAASAPDMLSQRGFRFPLLLRAPGFHQGEHFLRVEKPEDLLTALGTLPSEEVMVIEYLDARRGDGKSRKYRAMTIDGRLYPLHAAVSRDWKIHYFSAEMADSAEHRSEDRAFLEDMPGVIGPSAMRALEAIQQELGLDYGGIDFGLAERGDVLVFEANATMAVIPPPQDPRWDYRRPAVARICEAVHAMLRRHASTAPRDPCRL